MKTIKLHIHTVSLTIFHSSTFPIKHSCNLTLLHSSNLLTISQIGSLQYLHIIYNVDTRDFIGSNNQSMLIHISKHLVALDIRVLLKHGCQNISLAAKPCVRSRFESQVTTSRRRGHWVQGGISYPRIKL